MDILGTVALITGAASGIGFEIAKELLKNGAQGICIADINEENGEKAVDILSKEFDKTNIIFIKTDVTKENEFEDAFKKTIKTFGKIDILINNAGIVDDVNYRLEVDVNLQGVLRGILLGLKYLAKDQNINGGTILNICSTAAFELQQFFPVYSATKAGAINLTRGFGHPFHYNRTGVKIIALCPGKTETELLVQNKLYKGCLDGLFKTVADQEIQKPDAVGRAAIQALKNGETGSIWMIDQNNFYSFHIPEWESLRKLVIEGI